MLWCDTLFSHPGVFMPQKSGITSLVAASYPERTPFGTMARSTPPVVAVLEADGTLVARPVDPEKVEAPNPVVERLIGTIKRKEAEANRKDPAS